MTGYIYTGTRVSLQGVVTTSVIVRDMKTGTTAPLNPRFDVRKHSPDGFEWGYDGSGPAQLALALVLHHVGNVVGDVVLLRRIAGLADVCEQCDGTGRDRGLLAQAVRLGATIGDAEARCLDCQDEGGPGTLPILVHRAYQTFKRRVVGRFDKGGFVLKTDEVHEALVAIAAEQRQGRGVRA
jgi:hypothetical protein